MFEGRGIVKDNWQHKHECLILPIARNFLPTHQAAQDGEGGSDSSMLRSNLLIALCLFFFHDSVLTLIIFFAVVGKNALSCLFLHVQGF